MRFKLLFFTIALLSVAAISAGFYSTYGIIAGTTATLIAVAAAVAIALYTFKQPIDSTDGRIPYEFRRD